MYIKQRLAKQGIFGYFKKILYYCFLCWCSLVSMPTASVEAKTKKTAVQDDPAQQKNQKNKQKKKKKSTKIKETPYDIIAYTSLSFENPRKLAKYATFYHEGANCIGLNISKISLTNHVDIMQSIYCGKRLKSFTKDSKKSTWGGSERYYAAQSLAKFDYIQYQDYKKNKGNHANSHDGILTGLLKNAIIDAIQLARFKEDDAIFQRVVPYMAGLYSIKKQVQLSKINLVMLATTVPIVHEPVVW